MTARNLFVAYYCILIAFLLLSWFRSFVYSIIVASQDILSASQDILRAKLKILELFMVTGKEFFFVEFICGSGVGGNYNFN